MKKTVKEISDICGISIRTLRYYDQIGLLHPSEKTEAGYRIYEEKELARLQQILFFRELDFPLKEIQKILDAPSFDTNQALQNHRALLILKKKRLSRLISLVDQMLKGEIQMDFQTFDNSELETAQKAYAKEVRERWGNTSAYQEQQQKSRRYAKEDWQQIEKELNKIYREFANYMDGSPEDAVVQELVAEYQRFFSQSFYTCTPEILAGLGSMYTADPRFTAYIDRNGKGLADFLCRAIESYCKNKAQQDFID